MQNEPKVQSSDADVIIRSCDNIDFHVHKRHLEFATGGFPPADTPSSLGEIVRLSESSSTLEILFQFVYPQRHPSLDKLAFEELLEVAEAAEKYEVYGALSACHLILRWIIVNVTVCDTYTDYIRTYGTIP